MKLVAALTLFLVLAGCETPPPLNLQGPSGSWVLDRLVGAPEGDWQRPTITFENNRISGFAGCNRYFGERTPASGAASYFSAIGSTKMACPSPAMEVEDLFLGGLQRTRDARVINGRLVLFDPNDEEIMRFEAERQPQSEGGAP